MRPLDARWQADVQPGAPLRPGDIALYLDARGQPCLHRVLAVHDDRLEVRGDTAAAEPDVPRSAVIGRAVALRRGLLTIALPADGRVADAVRRAGLAWSAIAPVLLAGWLRVPKPRRNV